MFLSRLRQICRDPPIVLENDKGESTRRGACLELIESATDRAHRIGRTRKVTVYKMIAKDTIEEKIMELQEAKRDLADAILEGKGESLMSLSREELLALFS